MKYDNILVEKELINLKISNPVKVTLDFDRTIPPIGKAVLKNTIEGVYAEIETNFCLSGLYPAIGFSYERGKMESGVIDELSFCVTENQDKRIKSIKL